MQSRLSTSVWLLEWQKGSRARGRHLLHCCRVDKGISRCYHNQLRSRCRWANIEARYWKNLPQADHRHQVVIGWRQLYALQLLISVSFPTPGRSSFSLVDLQIDLDQCYRSFPQSSPLCRVCFVLGTAPACWGWSLQNLFVFPALSYPIDQH